MRLEVKQGALDNSLIYITRKDEWFKEGTEAELIANCGVTGLFKGWLLVTEDHPKDFHKIRGIGSEGWDEEMCGWDEFDIYDQDGTPVWVIEK